MRQRAVAGTCARLWARARSCRHRAPLVARRTHSSAAWNATPLRDSRATLHGGSERFQAAGEAGLTPASLLLDPASLAGIRVVSGGGGIRTLEPPVTVNGFRDRIEYGDLQGT